MNIDRKTKTVLAGAAAAGALAAYAFLVEPRWLQVTRTDIHVRGLHPSLEGFTIALLTDLHAGDGTPLSLIRRACRMAMAEHPDLIAVTGDLVADDAPGFGEVLDAVQGLSAPYGVYAVPGNHDHEVGIGHWQRDMSEQSAVTDLTNHAEVLDVHGARLCVAGVDDLRSGRPDLGVLPPSEARDFTLLLAHNPDQAERVRRVCDAVDLIVSGHTHGGQVRLPWVGAIRNPAKHDDLYEEGLRRRPWTQVYTSRGVGTVHIPVRFLCRPEVAMLTLTAAPRPPRRS
ncbi:MAG TPA: metallophosphoesterase [Longimicrobium sp.]|jgi:predicted MPP superfamily phosphohydrolase|nr:metallophosphoesterase [Longimicrobium sp.]